MKSQRILLCSQGGLINYVGDVCTNFERAKVSIRNAGRPPSSSRARRLFVQERALIQECPERRR